MKVRTGGKTKKGTEGLVIAPQNLADIEVVVENWISKQSFFLF